MCVCAIQAEAGNQAQVLKHQSKSIKCPIAYFVGVIGYGSELLLLLMLSLLAVGVGLFFWMVFIIIAFAAFCPWLMTQIGYKQKGTQQLKSSVTSAASHEPETKKEEGKMTAEEHNQWKDANAKLHFV